MFSKLETWSFTRCHNHQDLRPLAPGHRGNKLSNPVCWTSDIRFLQVYDTALKLLTCSNSNKGCRSYKNSHCVTLLLTAWLSALDYEPELGCSYFGDCDHTGAGARAQRSARAPGQDLGRTWHLSGPHIPFLPWAIHSLPHKSYPALITNLTCLAMVLVCFMLHSPSRKLSLTPPTNSECYKTTRSV